MEQIPLDILNEIFMLCDVDTLYNLKSVCKLYNEIINNYMIICKYKKSKKYNKHKLYKIKKMTSYDAVNIHQNIEPHFIPIAWMALNGYNEMILSFKKEFSEIEEIYYYAFDLAAKYGHNDTLLLLKKEFPKIQGTSRSYEWAIQNGHNDTLLLLKKEFPEIRITYKAFDLAIKNGHKETLDLLKKEFSEI